MTNDPLLIAIVGPTASGKSHLAIRVAQHFGGEILNCDSLQMYRYFDLGSAKTSVEQRGGVPHHFLDVLNPDKQFAAGEYMRQARAVLAEVAARGRLPVVVGGTGFYLRALIDGLFPGPSRNTELRERLAESAARRGAGYLHRLLRRLDAATAALIHSNDQPKLIRAIEVCMLARRPASELFREGRSKLEGFRVIKLGLSPPRDALYERINQRARQMFELGLIEEVKGILARGYASTVPPLGSHGYRQAVDFLEGRISLDEAIYHAQTRTRQYAKRQMTWFRKERDVRWLAGFGEEPAMEQQALHLLTRELATQAEPAGESAGETER
jgi:tRNA dimethylallyltransferase